MKLVKDEYNHLWQMESIGDAWFYGIKIWLGVEYKWVYKVEKP